MNTFDLKHSETALANPCSGGCDGCGKIHFRLFDKRDTAGSLLKQRLEAAIATLSLEHKIVEVSDPAAIEMAGIKRLPALTVEGELVSEGRVPETEDLVALLRKFAVRANKLPTLRSIGVAIDPQPEAESALRFAWEVAQALKAPLEVVYAMDSIFEGHVPSASGFLNSYQHTMQVELDAFIRQTLEKAGVDYASVAYKPGAPGLRQQQPSIASKVIYGFPDTALVAYSETVDLLIVGTRDKNNNLKKIFGSISTEVSKLASCPVMLVPPGWTYEGFKNILYASNFDSLEPDQIRKAVSFAQMFDGQIHFVHVGPAHEDSLNTERHVFNSVYKDTGDPHPFIFKKMLNHNVTEALYEYAFYHGINLMVYVTHQRSFWEQILHHSTTHEAVVLAQLPVLVLHTK
jgi:nucleotide-binding universal stress UspA family protein